MKKKIFTTAVLIFTFNFIICLTSFSQIKQEWASRYNGTGNSDDGGASLSVDHSGNIYVTGTCINNGTHEDFATIKYNPDGVQQWIAIYDGPVSSEDFGTSVAVDDSGYVYVTGSSTGSGNLPDIVTIKYNSSGDSVWVRRYNGDGDSSDIANSVAVDGLGNVYVSGSSIGKRSGYDYTLIKYDPSGEQIWLERYNGPGNGVDWVSSMSVDNTGSIYLTGGSYGKKTFYDYATIKYSPSGSLIWSDRYDCEKYNDEATSIAVDASGYVYVTGSSNSDFGFFDKMLGQDFATIKYTSSGLRKWVKRYNSRNNYQDVAKAVAVDSSGNIYVTGVSGLDVSGVLTDLVTIKYKPSGEEVWTSVYSVSESSDEISEAMAVDKSGNVFIAGSSSYDNFNYCTLFLNSAGKTLCSKRYNGAANKSDKAYSIAVDDSGNVYVTGESENIGSGFDIVTIKYSK